MSADYIEYMYNTCLTFSKVSIASMSMDLRQSAIIFVLVMSQPDALAKSWKTIKETYNFKEHKEPLMTWLQCGYWIACGISYS